MPIGTEWVLAGPLPARDAARARARLRKYIDLRIAFYRTRNAEELRQISSACEPDR